jgi:pyruvate dehydrogenase E2 component (dihydrolipoamide acetyltransferase)
LSATPESPRGLPVKEALPLGRVRRMMSQSMRDSVQRAALSQISREMDLTALQALRRNRRDAPAEGPRPGSLDTATPGSGESGAEGTGRLYSINIYLLRAVAQTLPRHPLLNAELVGDNILTYSAINLGMAIAVPDGLVVAVIREADKKSLDELAAASEDLAARARAGKLGYADIEGGTFTVSNLGMYGIDGAFPLPRPPEAAILFIGRSQPRPAVVEGSVGVRDLAWFSLTYDHRFIDGATGARFLQELQEVMLGGQAR